MKNESSITRKDKLWCVTLTLMIVCICAFVAITIIILYQYKQMDERADAIDYNISCLMQAKEKEKPAPELESGLYVMENLEEAVPGLRTEMLVTTPNNEYDFAKLELSCDKLVSDNKLFFENNLCPYVSPGVRYELRLRCDKDKNHYILLETINTGNDDACATNNEVYKIGFRETEGYGIGGIMIGDNMGDVVESVGQPDSFSISGNGKISGAMYDYGEFRINVVADILRGEVEYIEVERKVANEYWNGK